MSPIESTTCDRRTVILGVAASDSHAVANQLIARMLRIAGFRVVNLGTCTPIAEFVDALRREPAAEAVIMGSLNGHALEDLAELPEARRTGVLRCPVILGGNLSVGATKDPAVHDSLRELGVDHILTEPTELSLLLDRLRAARSTPARSAQVA